MPEETKTFNRNFLIAVDGSENSQRAVSYVVGRQGLSRKERFLFGSVSSKIVNHAGNCTVWVVS